MIGNLDADPPAVQPISTQAELLRLHRRTEPAAWALERLRAHAARQPPPHESPAAGASAPLWWVEPDSAPLLALESRLLEFLSTRRGTALQGKLQRINCPQALARWTLEHLAFARKAKAAGPSTGPAPCVRCCAASWACSWNSMPKARTCAPKWPMKAR